MDTTTKTENPTFADRAAEILNRLRAETAIYNVEAALDETTVSVTADATAKFNAMTLAELKEAASDHGGLRPADGQTRKSSWVEVLVKHVVLAATKDDAQRLSNARWEVRCMERLAEKLDAGPDQVEMRKAWGRPVDLVQQGLDQAAENRTHELNTELFGKVWTKVNDNPVLSVWQLGDIIDEAQTEVIVRHAGRIRELSRSTSQVHNLVEGAEIEAFSRWADKKVRYNLF